MVRRGMCAAAALASVLALAACSSGGGKDEAAPETETATTAIETTESSGTPAAADGVDPCELVDADVATAELGVDVTTSSAATDTGGQRCDYADDSGAVVLGIQVELGHTPETYRARVEVGGPIEELASAPGDAIWSAERRVLATLVGDAFVQVVQRSDAPTSAADAQEAALRLLDLVVAGLPTSSGTTTAASAEPFDPAGRSYEDNVLARVEEGDGTIGEGLVATLRMFAGELPSEDVLRVPDPLSDEGTGVIEMAREYAESGADPALGAELDRLLALLLFTPDQLAAMAAPAPAAPGATPSQPKKNEQSAPSPTRSLAQSDAEAIESCKRFYGWFETPPGVDDCLLVHTQRTGGVDFLIYEPAIDDAGAGWDTAYGSGMVGVLREMIDETVRQTFSRLGSLPFEMALVLSVENKLSWTGSGATVAMTATPYDDGDACVVTLHPAAAKSSRSNFKQILAHEFGHCFQNATFPDQQVDLEDRRWREEGFAEYLSAVAYPANNLELRFVDEFRKHEVETETVLTRAYENVVWFHYLKQVMGDNAIFSLIRNGPTAGSIDDQQAYLASVPEMDEHHHEFALATTDAAVADLDGSRYERGLSYNAFDVELEEGVTLSATTKPFGAAKFVFVVPTGMAATVAVERDDGTSVSARLFDEVGDWSAVQEVEDFSASCEDDASGTYVLVATGVTGTSTVTLRVTDLGEIDCEATGEADDGAPSSGDEDHCLVGTWKLVLGPPFMMQKVPLEFSAAQQAAMEFAGAKGDVILAVKDDGTFELAISNFDETIAFRDYTVVTKSNGNGSGTWKAEGEKLGVALSGRKFTTVVEGSIAGLSGKPVNAPPTYTYLWNDGRYTCTDERFGFTFPDGMSVSYVRR